VISLLRVYKYNIQHKIASRIELTCVEVEKTRQKAHLLQPEVPGSTWLSSRMTASVTVILDDRGIRECTSYILLSSNVSATTVCVGFYGDGEQALDFIIKKLHILAVTKIEGSKPQTPKPDIGHDTAPCKSRSHPHILFQCKMHYLPSPCQCFK